AAHQILAVAAEAEHRSLVVAAAAEDPNLVAGGAGPRPAVAAGGCWEAAGGWWGGGWGWGGVPAGVPDVGCRPVVVLRSARCLVLRLLLLSALLVRGISGIGGAALAAGGLVHGT